jgi:hypothetical protein
MARVTKYEGSEPIEFVRGMLQIVGNIKSFEIYYVNEPEKIPQQYKVPYTDEYGTRNHQYNLILKFDDDQELWIVNATCGYGGSGPGRTKEILQLCGVKMDYSIIADEEQRQIIREVTPHHDLNFVVMRPLDEYSHKKEKLFKISMTFEKAHKKWLVKDILEALGHINPLRDEDPERIEEYYFRHLKYSTEHEWAGYRTNNSLTLKRQLRQIDTETVINLFQDICYDHNVKHEVHEYNN